ncbi:MAG TPA: hypothetical protein VGD40_05205 [Chryseosolibacter sp.]
MKTLFKLLCASILLAAAGCSDENVEPLPLTEDVKTSATGYWDQFLSIDITTNFEDYVTFHLNGTGGEITVDWGDGASETAYVGPYDVTFTHDYNTDEETLQDFAIRVSGDIKTIREFNFYYASLYVNEVYFGGLTNLKTLSMGVLGYGPREINLSNNKLIESVVLPGIQHLENLILPVSNKIRTLDISGYNELSTAVVDRVIARVYDSVVRSPRTGHVNLPASWSQDDDDRSMVGPPSPYSVNKLRKLKRKYGWTIFPEVK